MDAAAADAGIAERIIDRQEERDGDDQHNVKDRRAEHGKAQQRALCRSRRSDLPLLYCHVSVLGGILASVVRSKNFKWRSGTANSYVTPISKLWPISRRAITFLPSALPTSTPARMNSAPRYSTFSTRNLNATFALSRMSSATRKCSGRKPTIMPSVSIRFMGGEPRKVATKVSVGSSYTSFGVPICRTTPLLS